jgi:putative Mg2+ transporter-C (MgtC) family protein
MFNLNASMRFDPLRVFDAIIVGISFIGAGTILKGEEKRAVHNLTTAASILITGAIGLTVGLNQFVLAIGVTALVFIVTFVLGGIEDRYFNKQRRKSGDSHSIEDHEPPKHGG